jgi:4a-hydroxytetrahydrobiopterin dehydratase
MYFLRGGTPYVNSLGSQAGAFIFPCYAFSKEGQMAGLAEKSCIPCRGGVPPLTAEQIKPLAAEVPGWDVIENHHIEKEFKFRDFKSALEFTNKVGAIAEEQAHHPDIYLAWGKVRVTIWTHKIDGLTESDFILAAKIEKAS